MRNRFLCPLCLLAFASPLPAANLFVNTAADSFDSGGTCSLREAVQATNNNADGRGCVGQGAYGADTIVLGSGTFVLNRVGTDDSNVLGDLDVLDDLTIDGVAAGATNIAGDTSAADGDRDRVVHVVASGSVVTLRQLTLRDGRTSGSVAGGGLRTEVGTTTILDSVVVGLNSSGGSAGGILNRGTLVALDSAVTNNTVRDAPTDGGGGGIFNSGTLTLTRVRVLDNHVLGSADGLVGGGGLRASGGTGTTIGDAAFEGNDVVATGGALATGGGLWVSGALDAEALTIRANLVSGPGVLSTLRGGAGGLRTGSDVLIRRALIETNSVDLGGVARGGGWFAECEASCDIVASELIVASNLVDAQAGSGGGIDLSGPVTLHATISGSTIEDNEVRESAVFDTADGGGIFDGSARLALVNSTVSGNRAATDGGGIFSAGRDLDLANVTIVGNVANADGAGDGSGGGLSIASSVVATMANSVVAGNVASSTSGTDCSGIVRQARFVLMQTVAGCSFSEQVGLFTGTAPGLGALADNGGVPVGSTLASVAQRHAPTRLPTQSSPLIDAGDPAGCRDPDNVVLALDQRRAVRPTDGPDPDTVPRCDIGAVEFSAAVFADGFE